MKLYELTGAFNNVFNLVDSDEEVNLQTLEDTLQAIEGAFEDKAGGIAKMILSLQKMAEAYTSEAERLADRAKSTKNKIQWFKNYLLTNMEQLAKSKIITDVGSINRQKSPPSVKVLDQNNIPEDYWYIPIPDRVLDKELILKRLKAGTAVPGAEIHQGYHIRIR